MSVKFKYDDSETFDNTIRIRNCDTTPTWTGTKTIRNFAYTDAERHRRKPKHLLPTYLYYEEGIGSSDLTNYECDKHSCGTSLRSGDYIHCHNSQTLKWNRGSGAVTSKGDNVAAKNSARLAAASAFTNQMASFGESLAELSETGKMIHKRASQVASIANALRTRNFGRLESVLHSELPSSVKRVKKGKELANGWLELEFGWKPLIQDIYTAVDLYRNGLVTRGQMVSAHGSKSGYYLPGNTPLESKFSNLYAGDTAARVKSRAYGIVRNPGLYTLNRYGLANPALLAWQLLPFSFVVDWFLPISQILGVMTNRIGLSDYVICVVSEVNSARMWRCHPVLHNARKRVWRHVYHSSYEDLLNISPRSLGLWHAATASALIRQSFGR